MEAWLPHNRDERADPAPCRQNAEKDLAVLEIRVLGGLEVIRDGAPATLPPSRKTRALLAYLALTQSPHRREELCEMFWDVPDDPRGALRWSLSKIRPVVDDLGYPRLVADRHSVELRTEALDIDLATAKACAEAAAIDDLTRAASLFRGPLLADLDLPANGEFHTWLLGLREDARKLQSQILRALTERLGATPQEALPYARELVRNDPYDETAWALLIGNLASAGRGQRGSTTIRGRGARPARGRRWVGSRCSKPGEQRRHQPPAQPIATLPGWNPSPPGSRQRRSPWLPQARSPPPQHHARRSSCCLLPI